MQIGHASLVCRHVHGVFMPFLAVFIQDPVPKDLNELCVISHKGETVTIVRFIGFSPNTNYYALLCR